jgi:PIN domain
MELAAAGLFRAKWTDKIHEEWITALLRDRPDLKPEKLQRTKKLMNEAVLDCLVEGYEQLIPSLTLPDKSDRQVLAAAIHSHCDGIITFNLRHFPTQIVAPYDIEVQHPDEFLHHQFGLDTPAVVIAAQRIRSRLKNPPVSAEDYLRSLESQGLVKTVGRLTDYAAVI